MNTLKQLQESLKQEFYNWFKDDTEYTANDKQIANWWVDKTTLAFEAGKAEAIAMVLKEISERDIFLLKELAEICREDDLLDLDSYDSISRSDRIGNAWEALNVIDKLDILKTKLQAKE